MSTTISIKPMSKLLHIAVIASALCLCACGSGPDEGFVPAMPQDKIRTLPYPVETIWSAYLEMLERKDIDLLITDRENRTIVTDFIPMEPKSEMGKAVIFREEGEYSVGGAKYDITAVMTEAEENRTTVRLEAKIDKYTRSWYSYFSWKNQPSNGYIERNVFAELALSLQGKR